MSAMHRVRLSPDGVVGGLPPQETKSKITFAAGSNTTEQIESRWKRPLQKTGTGATHVRTFTGKLTQQGMEHIDKHINEWLDNHQDAEVKFSTMQVGEMSTSLGKESMLVIMVWI